VKDGNVLFTDCDQMRMVAWDEGLVQVPETEEVSRIFPSFGQSSSRENGKESRDHEEEEEEEEGSDVENDSSSDDEPLKRRKWNLGGDNSELMTSSGRVLEGDEKNDVRGNKLNNFFMTFLK